MPKRKKEYQILIDHLQSKADHPEDEIKPIAAETYKLWNTKENQDKDIVDFYEDSLEKLDKLFGKNGENQAESSEKQEEETHDQNLKEKLVVKPDTEYKNPYRDEDNMEEDKVKTATSVPAKFDWEKYLEENPQFKTKDKDSGVEVLLLQFFKDIAHKEGFLSVRYSPLGNADQGYCGVSCEIEWPNLPRISSGLADAHFNNCHSFTKYYLSPMAENRSFIRAVKQYFNIPYLGKDEIGQTPKEEPKNEEAPTGPYVTLKKAAKDKLNITSFDGFKSFLRKQVKENPETAWLQPEEYQDWVDYNDWDEIKKPKILELIGKIKA